jgi:HAD superfamily hydrolase (TIGR01549 family)
MTRAVLFDLDDTLFDHHFCSRSALAAVQTGHACFRALDFAALERAHTRFLDELHAEVMLGRLPLDAAREERFRRLFEAAGVRADENLARLAATAYRDRYREVRRAVPGAAELLSRIRSRARIGIVSNNLLDEQQQKLRACGLDPWIDALVVSEEAGVSKPDPAIFSLALERLADSWAADIAGARACGIRPIWFNRHGAAPPDGDLTVPQIQTLEPPDAALDAIFA